MVVKLWVVAEKKCEGRALMKIHYAAQRKKFYIKDFFSKCDQIRRKLRIWSHLLKKSLMENFIFCPVCCLRKLCKASITNIETV